MVFHKFLPRFTKKAAFAALSLALLTSCIHKKYETPITKDTQQPDKVLFDRAIHDIERGRYEVARISLNTLMNTYESSEYLAKAKLAVADSWFREGGPNGMAQAEAEYKDFQLFYPDMEEAAQAQSRVCDIHYKQMDKSDRDSLQTLRAETECRAILVRYPNSKFVPAATQKLRDIQESLAEHEYVVGNFYWKREMNPAAANRLNALVDQYPLYSRAGEALYEAGDSYSKMGPRFRKQAGDMFGRVVSDYPLSERAGEAKQRLQDMELPVPPVNQAALEREKWEEENYHAPGMVHKSFGWIKGGPDVSHAAHSGNPTMTDPKKTLPASIPVVNTQEAASNTAATGTTDVSATQVTGSSALDTKPDARTTGTEAAPAPVANPAASQPLPTNRDKELAQQRKKQAKQIEKLNKKKKKSKQETEKQTPAAAAPQSSNSAQE
ncbi:MAG TPA: outer membrane protein assembly factor BamD [Bryobacteraceae bacterium]